MKHSCPILVFIIFCRFYCIFHLVLYLSAVVEYRNFMIALLDHNVKHGLRMQNLMIAYISYACFYIIYVLSDISFDLVVARHIKIQPIYDCILIQHCEL